MFALLGFIAGIVVGAAGAVSWLIAKPTPAGDEGATAGSPMHELRQTVESALQQGKAAGAEAERRKRQEFETSVRRAR